MREEFRLGKHRGKYVAVRGHGRNKRKHSLGIEARPHRKADAQREVHKLNALNGRPANDGTVASVFAAYIADREHDKVASVWRIRQAWKPLEPHFGHMTPDMIDKALCRKYIDRRRSLDVSNGGIKVELDYLSAALRFGRAEKLYPGSAPEILRPPRARPSEKWLTHEEARKLVKNATGYHVKLFILLALSTAGRPSHILQLTWDRVDLTRRAINLDDPGRDETQKGRARVPINDDAYEALKLAKDMATSKWVIEYYGEPLKRINQGVKAAARRAKLKNVSPYVLRHTAGVWMAQAGVPIAEIAQYMGHTSPDVTFKVYARFHPDYLRKASDALRLSEKPLQLEDGRE